MKPIKMIENKKKKYGHLTVLRNGNYDPSKRGSADGYNPVMWISHSCHNNLDISEQKTHIDKGVFKVNIPPFFTIKVLSKRIATISIKINIK